MIEDEKSQRFLNFFEKIQIEFPGGEYPPIEWTKVKSDTGSNYDCLEIKRSMGKELQR